MFIGIVFLFFILIGFVDLVLLIFMAHGGFGVWFLILSQLASLAVGVYHFRKMDANLLFFIDSELQKNIPIVNELWEEAILFTAVILLLIPGILSDLLGYFGLFPFFRNIFVNQLELFRKYF
ncbi:MAG: FxsA family protein [Deltaproteobacteria bacterium]|nr:FxsA family protein [Deltaproteobacteria bacterium]